MNMEKTYGYCLAVIKYSTYHYMFVSDCLVNTITQSSIHYIRCNDLAGTYLLIIQSHLALKN